MNKDIHPIELMIVAFLLLFEGLCWLINEFAGFHENTHTIPKYVVSMFKYFIGGALIAATTFCSSALSSGTMLASWYGPYFHGRTTANGETYDMYGLTAAHKTLPFGTKLRVCYDGCVDVRINDRGPYIGARELDLSHGAANAIGLINPGVANVQVSYL